VETSGKLLSSIQWPGERVNAPGPGTESEAFDATFTLLGESLEMSAPRTPIPDHPGFYRERGLVYFRVRDRRGRRRWLTAPTIKEAERKKVAAEIAIERGEFRERSRDTFASYAAVWVETYTGRTGRGISESTRKEYRRALDRHAVPFFGRMRLGEIEPQDVKAYVLELSKTGRAPNTVRLAVAPVKTLFATALEEGLIRSNPAAGIRLPQSRPTDVDDDGAPVKAMSEPELVALLAQVAADAPEWHLFFRFLAWSGLRIGEAAEVRWKDIDLGAGTVRVRRAFYDGRVGQPKSKYGRRTLRLPPELARTLWAHRAGATDDKLVFSAGGGTRIRQSNLVRRVLKPCAAAAGLGKMVRTEKGALRAESWVTLHTFRHTCATILFRRGWNAVQVQMWLGHHSPAFTLATYVHLLDADVPTPEFFDQLAPAAAGCTDQTLTREARNASSEPSRDVWAKPRISTRNADSPNPAETAGANS
jgi:integrase